MWLRESPKQSNKRDNVQQQNQTKPVMILIAVGGVFMNIWRYFVNLALPRWKILMAFLGGAIVTYWGNAPDCVRISLQLAGIVFIADLIFGSVKALLRQKFSSIGFERSVIKFTAYVLTFWIAIQVDQLAALYTISTGYTLQFIFLLLVITRETTSVLEHFADVGVPVKPVLKMLEKVTEQASDQLEDDKE